MFYLSFSQQRIIFAYLFIDSIGMTPLINACVHSEVNRTNPELLRHVPIKMNIALLEISTLDTPCQIQ
jgi:hypothetical protein